LHETDIPPTKSSAAMAYATIEGIDDEAKEDDKTH
jgi:hypothetical protein